MSALRRAAGALPAAALCFALLTSCDNGIGLPPAAIANVVDTVTLYALTGTAFDTPSAYSVSGGGPVRTSLSPSFDFAFDFKPVLGPVLLPTGAVGLPTSSGLLLSGQSFEAITEAPTQENYEATKPTLVSPGAVILVRSRPQPCVSISSQPLYAKLHVLALDQVQRTVQFEILSDQNCGYLGLSPGLPSR
ncbi:MAG TPA: hypothetical protein VLV16_07630 [Gemmatimonadales bacterium]|nr:hypothetical protein [Gemmatimonadales bacterium]